MIELHSLLEYSPSAQVWVEIFDMGGPLWESTEVNVAHMGDVSRRATDSIRPRSAPATGALSRTRSNPSDPAYCTWDPDYFDDRTFGAQQSAPQLPRKRLAILASIENPVHLMRSRSERVAIVLPPIPIRVENIFRHDAGVVERRMKLTDLANAAMIK